MELKSEDKIKIYKYFTELNNLLNLHPIPTKRENRLIVAMDVLENFSLKEYKFEYYLERNLQGIVNQIVNDYINIGRVFSINHVMGIFCDLYKDNCEKAIVYLNMCSMS